MWMGADLWARCTGWQRPHTGRTRCPSVSLCRPTAPEAAADLLYTVDRLGRLRVSLTYRGRPGLPTALFGLRFFHARAGGRVNGSAFPGQTYPDRKRRPASACMPRRRTPQGIWCPRKTAAMWTPLRLSLLQKDPQGRLTAALDVVMDRSPFAFSALPHTRKAGGRPPPGRAGRDRPHGGHGAGRGAGGQRHRQLGRRRGAAYQVSAEGDIAFPFPQPGSLPGRTP